MLGIHGHYRFATKLAACRNDYCTYCQKPVFTEGYRSFVVAHVNYIPLLPLGFRTRWVCTKCKSDPAGKRPPTAWLLWLGLLAGIIGLGIAFILPIFEPFPAKDRDAIWGMRAIFAAFTAMVIYNLVRRKKRGAYQQAKQDVVPLGHERCPYCGDALVGISDRYCGKCKIRVL
jgi:hypothetical protein